MMERRNKKKQMPSVGMRRSTRVFGTRVLRSGRRLSTEPHEGVKHIRSSLGENKFQGFIDNTVDGGDMDDHLKGLWQGDENGASDTTVEVQMEEREQDGGERENVDRKCVIVYKRKRKRAESTSTGLTEDGRYAKKYARKLWRTRYRAIEAFESRGCVWDCERTHEVAVVVHETSYDCYHWIICFLTSLLSYMTSVRIGVRQLSAFMLSKPIFDAYTSCGMLFLQDPFTADKSCVCIVTQSASVMPLFSVNIFAIPSFFAYLQTSMCLRSAYLDCLLVGHYENDDEMMTVADDGEEPLFQRDQQDCVSEASGLPTGSGTSHIDLLASVNNTADGRKLGQSVVTLAKSSLRISQSRNSRNIQKRRSSLRRKRGRPPSASRVHKAKGALASELFRIRQEGAQFCAASSSRLHRSSDKWISTAHLKDLKSSMAVATEDASVNNCSANVLIIDPDKCYRVEGATIALESLASNQWFLTVTKGGTKYCSLTAQNVMRPSSFNRFTHAIIWSDDQSLKFEFPDKLDWLVFKELYKKCSDRNMLSPAASVIPVPRVQEVPIPVDQHLSFVRPESYITLKDDELTRALMNETANYDMDSGDEQWLENLNNELNAGMELWECVTPNNFELVIDALEKIVHSNPDEQLDEQLAYDICKHLERKDVIEAIYKYWIRKRNKKRSALVRVFQLYQPRKSQVIPKFFLRKKRSFKRRANRSGRGKQQPLIEAIAAGERDALEQKNNAHKLREAKAAVDRNEHVAILKRQRAQALMQNADLATYKAMMALKIAQSALVDEAPEIAVSLFLG